MKSLDDRRFSHRSGLSLIRALGRFVLKKMLLHFILVFFLLLLLHSFIPASSNCSGSQYPVSLTVM